MRGGERGSFAPRRSDEVVTRPSKKRIEEIRTHSTSWSVPVGYQSREAVRDLLEEIDAQAEEIAATEKLNNKLMVEVESLRAKG